MKLIVGLGNIGKEYENTYHNVGFVMIDCFATKVGEKFTKSKFSSALAECKLGQEKVVMIKPKTYMNLSGIAVAEAIKKLKIDISDVLVIYDDVDLPVGEVRFRKNGSAGTHNGMKNIISFLASQDFPRIRVGIGKDGVYNLSDYVLSKIKKDDAELIENAKPKVMEHINDFLLNKHKGS